MLLQGKKALIMGLANNRSIAYGISERKRRTCTRTFFCSYVKLNDSAFYFAVADVIAVIQACDEVRHFYRVGRRGCS